MGYYYNDNEIVMLPCLTFPYLKPPEASPGKRIRFCKTGKTGPGVNMDGSLYCVRTRRVSHSTRTRHITQIIITFGGPLGGR